MCCSPRTSMDLAGGKCHKEAFLLLSCQHACPVSPWQRRGTSPAQTHSQPSGSLVLLRHS